MNKNSKDKGVNNTKSESKPEKPFYNSHTHIFNFDHVHNGFLKGMIPWWVGLFLLAIGVVLFLGAVYNSSLLFILLILLCVVVFFLAGVTFFPLKIHRLMRRKKFKQLTTFMKKLIPGEFDFLERYANFILHAYDVNNNRSKTQEDVFKELQSYYPIGTKFVVLSMDMDYMLDCRKGTAKSTYHGQLDELKALKQNNDYESLIFPFIHADPRRLAKDKNYFPKLKDNIEAGLFSGIKIYPALGYFPFDIRLKPVFDLALEYNLPITTHCSVGPVFYRGNLKTLQKEGYFVKGEFRHPFTHNQLAGKNARVFSPHFTHPLNYYFLMGCPKKLFEYWRDCALERSWELKNLPIGDFTEEELKKYKDLKICLGHFGGSEEWCRYLDNAWQPKERLELKKPESFKRMIHEKNGMWKLAPENGENIRNVKPLNWFSIISEMLKVNDFPNLYADISYNLSDHRMMPLLKVRLETDPVLRNKILFGTDFYMVSMKMTERRATINLRAFLGEDNFQQIAAENPKVFLTTLVNTPSATPV